MSNVARALLGLAVLAGLVLLAALVSSAAWLWLLLAGVIFLLLYARSGGYAALLTGALLTGAAVGILLEVALRWQGAFLVSVGAAALMVEGIEQRRGHWAFVFGVAFVGIGAVVTLAAAGARGYLAASLAAAVAAAVLALRLRR
ncbi:MAG: hypothetical protein WC972_08465 [Trueperaceae bacterium]|jgi:hypothetical protein|nr:hypothetical protein [Truepera sp.]